MMKYESLIRQRFEVISQSGDEFLCRCPFHNDTGKPNLYANGDKGLYFCHACKAKGKVDGDIPPDWESLIARLGGPLEPPTPDTYGEEWLDQFDIVETSYWEERGYTPETIKQWRLGYNPWKDAGTIPIRNDDGDILGVIRRNFDPEMPKYMYPKGVKLSKILWGASALTEEHTKVALVEGSLDAIACWQARVPALGLLGSHMSLFQYKLLKRLDIRHIVVFTDNDDAGRSGAEEIIEVVDDILVSVARYRPYWNAKDPSDLTDQQIRKAFHSAKRIHS